MATCGEGAERVPSVSQAFLLRKERMSIDGIEALSHLQRALHCSPGHPKLWFRYGFLLHRQLQLSHAAMAALKHAVSAGLASMALPD